MLYHKTIEFNIMIQTCRIYTPRIAGLISNGYIIIYRSAVIFDTKLYVKKSI